MKEARREQERSRKGQGSDHGKGAGREYEGSTKGVLREQKRCRKEAFKIP